ARLAPLQYALPGPAVAPRLLPPSAVAAEALDVEDRHQDFGFGDRGDVGRLCGGRGLRADGRRSGFYPPADPLDLPIGELLLDRRHRTTGDLFEQQAPLGGARLNRRSGATASEQAVARAQVQPRLLDPFPVTHQAVGLKNRKQVGLEARDVRRAVAGGPQEGSEGSGENEHHPKVVPARQCGSAGADSRHELRSLAPYSRARPGSPELDTTGRSR